MREIGISPRFSRDKFVPLQTKQRYSTRDISGEVSLTLFFRGFVPFLSLADFVSRNKNLQVADLQRLKSCFGELVTATTRMNTAVCTARTRNASPSRPRNVTRLSGSSFPRYVAGRNWDTSPPTSGSLCPLSAACAAGNKGGGGEALFDAG